MSDKQIFIFQSVHKVMKADRLLRDSGIFCNLVPVPEHISSECGMCLMIETESLLSCKEMLEARDIQFEIHKPNN